jgi:hypothetical protein
VSHAMRAKFVLSSVAQHASGVPGEAGGAKTLKFYPQYDLSIPEDVRYAKATPGGHIEMLVDNPAVLERLKIGAAYYVDFTPA